MTDPTNDSSEAPAEAQAAPDAPTKEQVMADSAAAFDAVAAAAELADTLGEEAAPPPSIEQLLQREVLELTGTLDTRNKELALANARAAAAEEETEKVKLRVEREAAKQQGQKSRKFLLSFLEVLDDLDRALVSVREDVADGDATQEVVRGVELVRSSFLTKLGGHGVTHRPSMGEKFDPNYHEGLSLVPVADASQDGMIIGVIREGYMIGEEVLRAAGVAVGKKS